MTHREPNQIQLTLAEQFQTLLAGLAEAERPISLFAELNDLLTSLSATELGLAVGERPRVELDPYRANYVAALVEHATHWKGISPPEWTRGVPPLEEPVFGSPLLSLRLHLLTRGPVAFHRRNIFIDPSTVGRA